MTDLSKPHAGENVSSVGVKVTKGKRTAFLAADISAEGGLENRMAPLVGKVDLLKVGHHGYTTATNPFSSARSIQKLQLLQTSWVKFIPMLNGT